MTNKTVIVSQRKLKYTKDSFQDFMQRLENTIDTMSEENALIYKALSGQFEHHVTSIEKALDELDRMLQLEDTKNISE